jgi:hypothetical protein
MLYGLCISVNEDLLKPRNNHVTYEGMAVMLHIPDLDSKWASAFHTIYFVTVEEP